MFQLSLEQAQSCLQPCSADLSLQEWLKAGEKHKVFLYRDEERLVHLVEAYVSKRQDMVILHKMHGSEFVIYCTLESELTISCAKGSVLSCTGYSESELVGQKAHVLLAALPFANRAPSVISGGRALGRKKPALVFMRRKDGTVVPVLKQLKVESPICEAVFLDVGHMHAAFSLSSDGTVFVRVNEAFKLLVCTDDSALVGSAVAKVVHLERGGFLGWSDHEVREVELVASSCRFQVELRRCHDPLSFVVLQSCRERTALAERSLPFTFAGINFHTRIGKGSFSTVYQGDFGDKFVAIKAISKSLQPRKLQQTEMEIQRQMSNCPFVVKLFDALESDKELFLIMECMSISLNLRLLMEDQGLPEIIATPYLVNILHAISYMHERFVAHLDVKLENVLLCRGDNQVAKLCDFGLAVRKTKESWNEADLVEQSGTPMYAAPEMFKDNVFFVGGPSDVWSFGVCVFVLLTQDLFVDPPVEVECGAMKMLISDHNLSLQAEEVILACLKLSEVERPNIQKVLEFPLFGKNIQEEI